MDDRQSEINKMKNLLPLSYLRPLFNQWYDEEISISRFKEIIVEYLVDHDIGSSERFEIEDYGDKFDISRIKPIDYFKE